MPRIAHGINPCCGYSTDAADNPLNLTDVPSRGDFVLCFNCGSLLVFKDAKKNLLRTATPQEVFEFETHADRRLNQMRRHIIARGWLPRMKS